MPIKEWHSQRNYKPPMIITQAGVPYPKCGHGISGENSVVITPLV